MIQHYVIDHDIDLYGELGLVDLVLIEFYNIIEDMVPSFTNRAPNPGLCNSYLYTFYDMVDNLSWKWTYYSTEE